MHMHEVYRVFEIVMERPSNNNMSDAIVMAHNHVKEIEGASVEWIAHGRLRLKFEEHVSAHNVMLDIMDKLSEMGYK